MTLLGGPLAIAASDRWLLAFALATGAVLLTGWLLRRTAREARARARSRGEATQGLRRRAGILLALGPLIGFATSPSLGEHALVLVIGAVGLAVVGNVADQRTDGDRIAAAAILAFSLLAVVTGVELGPTGVGVLDVVLGFGVIALVTAAANGFGNTEGLAPTFGALSALAVFALAGFAGQDSLAAVGAGMAGACVAFLAFNTRPASLFVGRGGRLAIGYTLAVGALSVDLPIEPAGQVVVPLILVGLLLLDGVMVAVDRLRRRQPLFSPRRDHLAQRLMAHRWSTREAVGGLLVAQLVLVLVAIFTGRGVLAVWLGAVLAVVVIAALGTEANRYRLEQERARGFPRWARITVGVIVVVMVLAIVPSVLVVPDVRDSMEAGRTAATRALTAARNGDAPTAQINFRRAAGAFEEAADQLSSPLLVGGRLVPVLGSNVHAARTLADVGADLAAAGEELTGSVNPEALEVIDGRLPLEEVQRVQPVLEDGAVALEDALRRINDLDDPYLISAVSEPLDRITRELSRAAKEASNGAAAARHAPAIFGGDEPRTYLLIVQNNAQLRASGGAITNWGLLTVDDGDISVSDLRDPLEFQGPIESADDPTRETNADYEARFPFNPRFAMQDANRSPHFPSVAKAIASVAPEAGLGEIDGVIAVDPVGLAALLELTGPVRVPQWPTDISASNVVDVTMKEAYEQFPEDDRNEFLGDVAEAVVDEATSGNLGQPARIAKILGGAAHEGHVTLWFRRPAEQRVAEQLEVAGNMRPVRSDALGVYTQNNVGTKIDTYLERSISYRVRVAPEPGGELARVRGDVTLEMTNTAPTEGLSPLVIGPFREYAAGENSQWVNVFTPLGVRDATLDGQPVSPQGTDERGRVVHSLIVPMPSQAERTLEMKLRGRVRLVNGWYELDLSHQPTLVADQARVAIEVPKGWEIVASPRLTHVDDRRVSGVVPLDRDRVVRVKIAENPGSFDLWDRLEAGR